MQTVQQKDSKLWFAAQLYQRGVVSADEFAEAVSRQIADRPPLGSVAIARGKLSKSEVADICAAQVNAGHKRFGEVAVEMGLLTDDDVDELLAVQSESVPDLLEIFEKMGTLTRSQLETAVALWGRSRGR